jgi:hypothetical protein
VSLISPACWPVRPAPAPWPSTAVKQAIRLSPRDPYIGAWYDLIGTMRLLLSHTFIRVSYLMKANLLAR